MKRFLFLVCGLVAVAASTTVFPGIANASNMTAAQIVSKNVAARGGLKAWQAVSTLTLSGRLEAGGTQNEALPFVMKMKRPNLSRLEISFEGKTAQQVYDGKQGWKVRPFLGRDEVESFTAAEAKAAKEWQELDGPLVNYAKKGISVKSQGTEAVEGHRAYKLLLTMKDGQQRHVWIDASTFLERKMDGEPRMLDGKLRHVAIFYRDYKTDNGLTMPHVLETVIDGGKQPHKMYVERVAVNQSMENALFAKPNLVDMAVAKVSMKNGK